MTLQQIEYEVMSEGWIVTLRDAIVKARPSLPGCAEVHPGMMAGVLEISLPGEGVFMYATPYKNEGGQEGISVMMDSDSPWMPDKHWDHSITWTGDTRKDIAVWTKVVSKDLKSTLKKPRRSS